MVSDTLVRTGDVDLLQIGECGKFDVEQSRWGIRVKDLAATDRSRSVPMKDTDESGKLVGFESKSSLEEDEVSGVQVDDAIECGKMERKKMLVRKREDES